MSLDLKDKIVLVYEGFFLLSSFYRTFESEI